MYSVGLRHACILQPFVAVRANGTEGLERIRATLGFVQDVSHCQANGSAGRKWIGVAGGNAAHLASETIPLKNPGTSLFGDATLKSGHALDRLQQILAGFQVRAILMRKNLPAFLITEFPDTARPFGSASARCMNVSRFQDSADVG